MPGGSQSQLQNAELWVFFFKQANIKSAILCMEGVTIAVFHSPVADTGFE